MTRPDVRLAEAVVYAGDLDRMRAFYERCLGLAVASTTDGYCELESPAWRLTLVRSADALPRTTPPPRRSRTAVKLAFEVADIAMVRALAPDLGGEVGPVTGEWRFHDEIRCDATDPEGNVVQLMEPATL